MFYTTGCMVQTELNIYFWHRFGLENTINTYLRLKAHILCDIVQYEMFVFMVSGMQTLSLIYL